MKQGTATSVLSKRAAALLFFSLAIALVLGCNKSNPEPSPGPSPSAHAQAQTTAKEQPTETTSAIVARVQSKGFQVQNLSVIRSGSVLKLSGIAKTEADKKGAEDVARASPGVTDIQSSITIAP